MLVKQTFHEPSVLNLKHIEHFMVQFITYNVEEIVYLNILTWMKYSLLEIISQHIHKRFESIKKIFFTERSGSQTECNSTLRWWEMVLGVLQVITFHWPFYIWRPTKKQWTVPQVITGLRNTDSEFRRTILKERLFCHFLSPV